MPWTVFKLHCVHIRPPRSHHGHSTSVPLWHQGPLSQRGRKDIHTPAAKLQLASLPARSFMRGQKEMDITGNYIKTVQRVDHVLPDCHNQSQVLIATRGSVISISLDPLTTTWLKTDLRQTPTCSKLSPPGYRHLTTISSMMGYMPGCHSSDQWRSDGHHLLTMSHVHTGVIINFAALFFKHQLCDYIMKYLTLSPWSWTFTV